MIAELESKQWYQELNGEVNEAILTYQEKRGYFWDNVDSEHLRYFKNNSCGYPFTDHLALSLIIDSNQNLTPNTVYSVFISMNIVFKELFKELKLKSMNEFDADIHLSDYLREEILPSHSDDKRSKFFKYYKSSVKKIYKWYDTKLTEEQRETFSHFLFPRTHLDLRDFKVGKLARENAKSKRKFETDAIVKDFIKIRAEGGFRLNQVRRLRQAYREVVELVKSKGYALPYYFAYIDNEERIGMPKQHLSFILWDEPSFVLHHSENYGATTIRNAKQRKTGYSEKNNEYFVEFLKAEILNDKTNEPAEEIEGFWFLPLLKHQLIGSWNRDLSEEERNEKLKLLEMYGYHEPGSKKIPVPFSKDLKGMLSQGTFVTSAQKYTDSVLMNVDTLYVSTLFGAVALDIFTSSGARLGELAQIHFASGCLNQTSNTDPETGETRESYMFRTIPKGRNKPPIFYVSKDTFNLIEEILVYLLDEHYKGQIPKVKFNYRKQRGRSRPNQPYMIVTRLIDAEQYIAEENNKYLSDLFQNYEG